MNFATLFTSHSTPSKLVRADSEKTQVKKAIESMKQEASTSKAKAKPDSTLVDLLSNVKKLEIHEDFACMLNQTNVIDNNNKFYVIQVAKAAKSFYLFTRWGRVVSHMYIFVEDRLSL